MSGQQDHRMGLIEAFKKKRCKPDSVESARQDIRYLLRLSLGNLVTAGNMAEDPRLPRCLSTFAREITRVDDGTPFRPGLRKLIRSWLEEEGSAEEWLDYLERDFDGLDPYLRSFLYPLAKTLLGRNRGTHKGEAQEKDLAEVYH